MSGVSVWRPEQETKTTQRSRSALFTLAAERDHFDLLVSLRFVRCTGLQLLPSLIGVTVRANAPYPGDRGAQLLVGGALAHHRLQVETVFSEQARDQLSIGCQADSRAAAAEGLGHGTDDPDRALAIQEFVVHSRRAALIAAEFTDRKSGMDRVQHFLLGIDLLA